MESAVHASVPLRVGKKMRKRRELDALVGGGGSRGGRLLSASSDEGEPWGRRTSRRRRSRPFVRLAALLAFCICVVSAATVLWLFVDVRRQIASLRVEMDRVSKTSSTYNDAIQTCHMDTKEVKGNVTELAQRLKLLETSYNKLADQVNQVTTDLKAVTDQLSAAPKLADTPRKLAELERTVGNMGSQISGFDSTISSWRKQAQATAGTVDELRSKLTEIEVKANETMVNITSHAKLDVDIRTDIAALNNTLSAKVDALETRIQALSKPMSTAAPVPPPVATPTSSTAAVNVTSTTTTTTLPPGKPAVLH